MGVSFINLAPKLQLTPEELERRSLRAYLRQELHKIQTEILHLCAKYSIASSAEMLAKYESGELSETGSWEDFFRLDHLEAKQNELEKLLGDLS